MTELRCGNDRLWTAWTAEENQKQVSPSAHSPWKSLRDSHIPAATTHDRIPLSQHQKRKEITLA